MRKRRRSHLDCKREATYPDPLSHPTALPPMIVSRVVYLPAPSADPDLELRVTVSERCHLDCIERVVRFGLIDLWRGRVPHWQSIPWRQKVSDRLCAMLARISLGCSAPAGANDDQEQALWLAWAEED